ncbi:hypothetical protein GQ457_13G009360 [Hibiscus cannabinus]
MGLLPTAKGGDDCLWAVAVALGENEIPIFHFISFPIFLILIYPSLCSSVAVTPTTTANPSLHLLLLLFSQKLLVDLSPDFQHLFYTRINKDSGSC